MSYATLRAKIEQLIEKAQSGGGGGAGGNVHIKYSNDGGQTIFDPDAASLIPEGYTRVEYLESTGTQYINTGVVYKNAPRVDAVLAVTVNADLDILGTPSLTAPYFVVDYALPTACYAKYGNINKSYVPDVTLGVFSKVSFGQVWIEDGKTKATFNTSMDFSTNQQAIHLFSARTKGKVRFKSVQIYDGDTLARDMLPCIRLTDNVAGMYDIVWNVFYTNNGTGTFVTGDPVSNVGRYIGVYIGAESVAPDDPSVYTWSLIANNGELFLQDKTITPTGALQQIEADQGYDGLGIVTVEAARTGFPLGENLADPNGIIANMYIHNSTGAETPYGNWSITSYVSVEPGKNYSVSSIGVIKEMQYSGFYNADKQWQRQVKTTDFVPGAVTMFAVPDGMAYVRFSASSTDIGNCEIREVAITDQQ